MKKSAIEDHNNVKDDKTETDKWSDQRRNHKEKNYALNHIKTADLTAIAAALGEKPPVLQTRGDLKNMQSYEALLSMLPSARRVPAGALTPQPKFI